MVRNDDGEVGICRREEKGVECRFHFVFGNNSENFFQNE